jgi:hypothetical protein
LTGTVKVLGLNLLKVIVKMLQVNHWPGYQAEDDHIRYVAWVLGSQPDGRKHPQSIMLLLFVVIDTRFWAFFRKADKN